ncbi:MAG: polyprenyl diphosphate synthase [Patescibacteria group bacterium]
MKKKIPICIGVIMDGNRRFAKQKGISTLEGHSEGYENFKKFLRWSAKKGVDFVIAYAFSVENWKRSKKEVKHLINLFSFALAELEKDLSTGKLGGIGAFSFIGDLSRFGKTFQTFAEEIQKKTLKRKGMKVALALSYGGRQEILGVVEKYQGKNISQEKFGDLLLTKGFPDPDIILRTGGERRLSNFLLWQSAYSELFFTDTLWPEFTEKEFNLILKEFSSRKRNFGK